MGLERPFRRTRVCSASNLLGTSQRLASAYSVVNCAASLASPRYLTLRYPSWHLTTRKTCSSLARMLALTRSIRSAARMGRSAASMPEGLQLQSWIPDQNDGRSATASSACQICVGFPDDACCEMT